MKYVCVCSTCANSRTTAADTDQTFLNIICKTFMQIRKLIAERCSRVKEKRYRMEYTNHHIDVDTALMQSIAYDINPDRRRRSQMKRQGKIAVYKT